MSVRAKQIEAAKPAHTSHNTASPLALATLRDLPTRSRPILHVGIVRAAPAFRHHPFNVLCWVFDVTGFAVDAVLRIDLQPGSSGFLNDLVHPSRAVALLGCVIERQIGGYRYGRVLEPQVGWLILLVIGVGDIDRSEPIESEDAVGLRILDLRRVLGELETGIVQGSRPRKRKVESADPTNPP